ncbi:hypothetical protein V1517DRAFT_310183 [Lipomyces orientalis]|uniref:Uncharacterized protein n=1 Tax=Lipomyces orientalis TaxID=1233043 RepID=A0ACC3TFU1_9ASCO
MPTLITAADKEKIKRAIPKASNKVIDAVVARLYIAYPDPNVWTFTGVSGAVALVNDLTGNTFFLKIVDIIGNRGVIWDQELYVDFQYNQDRAFFHTFELEECYAGLLFADDTEAHHFLKKVQQKEKYASKATLNNKNAVALKKPEKAVQGPRGDVLRYQKLGNNYTLAAINNDSESDKKSVRSSDSKDDDVDPSWRNLVEKLQEMGISEEMLASNADALKDYIKGGGDATSVKHVDKKAKGPPPPPPLQPPTSRTLTAPKAVPPPPLSQSPTPPPAAPAPAPAEAPSAPVGPLYKVPPPFNPATLPDLPLSSRSPAPRQSPTPSPSPGYSASPVYSSTPSPEPGSPAVANAAENRRTPAPGHKYNVPPPFPNTGSAMAPRQPIPGPGSQLPARGPPPLLPSRDSPGLSPVGSPPAPNLMNRPVPAPPSLPRRVPVQNGMAPVFAQATGHGPTPPPPPPHKHGSRTAVQNTATLTPPLPPPPPPASYNRTSVPPITANTVPIRPPRPPASYSNYAAQQQSSVLPPPPPPPPPVSYMKPAATPQNMQQSMQYSAPVSLPPVAPMPFSVPTVVPPPPPPPSFQNFPSTGVAPPPPPPGFSGNSEQAEPMPLPGGAGGGRDALMASIRGSGGVNHLKKVDKTHLERPMAISQTGASDTSRGSGADTPGNSASLQDALAVALSKRKTRVAGIGETL